MDAACKPGPTTALVGALALVCVAVVRLLLGPSHAGLVLDGLLALVAVLAALDAARLASRRRSAVAWRFQWLAPALWALAPAAWVLGLPDAVAQVARVGFVVVAVVAWWLTSHGADPWSRVRLGIDSGMAAASCLTVGWALVLGPAWDRAGGGVDGVVALGLPLAMAGLAVFAAALALTEMQPSRRLMPALFVLGMLVVAASDVLHARGETPLWAVGFAAFVLATRTYGGTSARREVISTRNALVHFPYLLIAPAVGTLVVHHVRGGVPTVEAAAAVVMAALLLARQHVTLSENRGLVDRLAASEQRLRHQATHDSLTGLAGRVLLYERLSEAVERRRREPLGLAVVFVDLDDFKVVNDTLGHAAGDDVLVETARRLLRVLAPLGPGATVARMSGDEFAVLLTGRSADDAVGTARRIVDVIGRRMSVNGVPVRVGGSVGVAVADGDVDPSSLLRAADVAMYEVKRGGKNGVELAARVGGVAERAW